MAGVMGDLASSLTGKVECAYIIIKDRRSSGGGGGLGLPTNQVVGRTANVLDGGTQSLVSEIMNESTDKKFQVQFNPSGLQIYANSTVMERADTQRKEQNQQTVGEANYSPTIELSIPLVFDHVNIYDSFMWDKITAGVSATGLTNIVSAVASAKGKVWTVQTEVEGLVAALRNQYTRNISFVWSQFSFIGQLVNVSATYTMFNTSGRPVRAKVQLRLKQDMNPVNLERWYADFDQAFGNDTSNLVRSQQGYASLLNLGL